MRIRRKKWAEEELKNSPLYISRIIKTSGNWNKIFNKSKDNNKDKNENENNDNNNIPIYIEIGMGKGMFISKIAKQNPEIRYIGIDMIEAMLGLAKRQIENEYLQITYEQREQINDVLNSIIRHMSKEEKIEKRQLIEEQLKKELLSSKTLTNVYKKINQDALDIDNFKNIRILDANAENIETYFSKKDNVQRIYLNFSNPWPKDKHKKRRLTHNTKLEKYKQFLTGKKEIFFKTDDYPFFEESRQYFKEMGFSELVYTHDLEKKDIFLEYDGIKNIETEHEKMFKAKNIKINGAIYKILN